ncbi:C40 family peptidase [Nakamurella leprariae]|uniref:C40 family peptidase n=1 Tax=Nakamurella leprariae TaxID=2803911 RepID=A0A939C1A2_9ACTN|nr:C40 family peptidase [Nakamurella leprariae]MBM9466929.1 C40 family peptidase [Nakamurella leprariae]
MLATALLPMTASADPVDGPTPSTSEQAKQAWLDAERQAEILNEDVLEAQQAAADAATAAADAAAAAEQASSEATVAGEQVTVADAAAAEFQGKVDKFANASFRGARLNEVSALLTAESADDFLDQATSLDRVAKDSQATLTEAFAAKEAAAQAKAEADAAATTAAAAKSEAEASKVAADDAVADASARKVQLDAQVAEYERLYEQLSEQEREAALAAEEARVAAENEAAAAQVAQATATEAAAAAPARADRSTRTEPLAAAAPVPAAAPAAAPSSAAPAPAAAAPAAAPAGSSKAQAAVAAALSKVGSRYVYGAAGPNSFDCSGLTSWAWAQAGVTIPRTSRAQAGLPSVPLSQLQPGDLVTYYSPVSHVGMYIGNGQIVHASTSSKPVYVTTVAGGGPNPTGHRVTG